MPTRREFLARAGAIGVTLATIRRTAWAARASGPRIKALVRREETVIRHGGDGDNWHMSWAADDRQYVSLCDGTGFSEDPRVSYNSHMFAISGGPQDARFHDLPGYPLLGKPTQKAEDPRYYNFGTLALNGHLYQFMSTINRPFQPGELVDLPPPSQQRVGFVGVKLVYSPDNGQTWRNQDGSTPVVWEPYGKRSRQNMVFFEEDQHAFSMISILQMGKNYEHNRDSYLYVYAPNGTADGRVNELVMFRVPKAQLLNRGSYEYFAGLQQGGRAKWDPNIDARAIVYTFPRGYSGYSWMPSVTYNAPLGVYLMVSWGSGVGADGRSFGKPSYLGFWIGPNPWGPWTQIHEETVWLPGGDQNARAYQPQIAPKWIAPDGKSFWLVWTDYQGGDGFDKVLEEMQWDRQTYTEAGVKRLAALRRKHLPYYAFNVQRVDLVVS